MSHRHYWAEIEYQGAALAGDSGGPRTAARNAEKLGLMVPDGSRSSSLGDPGESNIKKLRKNLRIKLTAPVFPFISDLLGTGTIIESIIIVPKSRLTKDIYD